jgi:hypothetical protein
LKKAKLSGPIEEIKEEEESDYPSDLKKQSQSAITPPKLPKDYQDDF